MNTDTPMPAKVLLIDLENCPNQINDLLSTLSDYAQVVICYAQSGAKVPLDLADAAVRGHRLAAAEGHQDGPRRQERRGFRDLLLRRRPDAAVSRRTPTSRSSRRTPIWTMPFTC